MARKATKSGEVNKSQAVRDSLATNPEAKASDVIAELKGKGIDVKPGLFYLIKGKLKGEAKRTRKTQRKVAQVVSSNGSGGGSTGDVLSTIRKVKALAAEVGGIDRLKELVEALSE